MGIYHTLFSAMLGSLGFSLLFNVRGRRLIWAALGGLISWSIYLLAKHFGSDAMLATGISTLASHVYAQHLARVTKSPSTVYLVPALIPLIPGGDLYYTMLNAVRGNWDVCFQQGVHTLTLAGAIAVALTVGSSVTLMSKKVRLQRWRA